MEMLSVDMDMDVRASRAGAPVTPGLLSALSAGYISKRLAKPYYYFNNQLWKLLVS